MTNRKPGGGRHSRVLCLPAYSKNVEAYLACARHPTNACQVTGNERESQRIDKSSSVEG